MRDRTVTISGLSKTFSVTGWRLGYCIASPAITDGIRRAHDFLTVGAPHPLQVAGAAAMALPLSYYERLKNDYKRRRDIFLPYLRQAGFSFQEPEGAYYVMTDMGHPGWDDDTAFVHWMIREIGVSAVPGSSFYSPRERGNTKVRFMFAKRDETLHEAGRRLARLPEISTGSRAAV
jgi:aminotransferase